MKKIRRDDFLPDFFYALFLERSLERFRHGFLHDAKDILDDCVVHVTAVNDAAAVLREEELLRRLVFLVRLVELVLDELLDFLFRHPSHLFPIITCIYYYTTSCAFFPCFFEINL